MAKGCGQDVDVGKKRFARRTECLLINGPSCDTLLGTTPDSSALTPTLISICQQISYNYMLPFENIPDDLVPLTAHFKQLLTYASVNQPLTLYLDSVDQLTGTQTRKVSWIPTRLPPNCKIIISCANEECESDRFQEYYVLRKMIDIEENFIELVFAEICRWRSYTKPQETHLANTVMDSIMMLFERIENSMVLTPPEQLQTNVFGTAVLNTNKKKIKKIFPAIANA
ncbi:unnamed protein product [Ceratitis capitata]|uniref:(Mediterranean fruit fly) hypothetical protein n=1 Tax=Ceratitis capitata TaxID=7213 RepID=A0A811UF86_CERCA|nr:unnamed protein product [Ceratitis capitata]